MENFKYYNPTKVFFGKDVLEQLCTEISPMGKKALLVIGKNSVKTSGLYARVVSLMNICGVSHYTYEGIKANPIVQHADEAVALAKEKQVSMIIAIGGGSVIDTAKAIAIGYYVNHSVWDFYTQKVAKPTQALPLFTILTLAATGTEMNSGSVLQHNASGMKLGYSAPCMFPKVSFLDPHLTLTVPANQTAFGISDLISHALEQFFGKGESPLSDLYTASVIKLAIKYGQKLMLNLQDYEAREQIMWLATNALNGTLKAGKNAGDWGVHDFEHTLSVLYDIAHGAGLSIVYPAWLRHHQPIINAKLAFLATKVFDIDESDENLAASIFIKKLESFYKLIGTPVKLNEVGILPSERNTILSNLKFNKVNGSVYTLNETDYEQILDRMW
ncbi:MAG: iron-containing alcohol dehydrogenase [Sphingobacteriales bacterium]|nr:MAG: iron-containing alcohol dehydrogenase [Sphingobacteriales bacterium]TAF83935.1 MAG: iron-containing alcohol dehydrogenase [Sphingobacteriales bacterium]